MNFLIGLLFFIVVLCSIMLIGIILIQQSKSGGGLGVIGGGMTESVLGATAGNVITKATVILATIFFACTFLLAIVIANRTQPENMVERYEQTDESALQQGLGDMLGETTNEQETAANATEENEKSSDNSTENQE